MKVFTCNDHWGYWPVGAASVIVAHDEKQARGLMLSALQNLKLDKTPEELADFTLIELNVAQAHAVVLCDGNY